MQNNQPKSINDAIAQANRYERAKKLIEEGYTFTDMKDGCGIAVCKPGKLAAAYWIYGPFCEEGCSCPDFTKNENRCKHMLCWEAIKAEEAEEQAGLEAQAAQYDAENEELPEFDQQRILMLSELRRAERGLAAVDPFTTTAQGWRERIRECTAALKLHDEVTLKTKIAYYRGEKITA